MLFYFPPLLNHLGWKKNDPKVCWNSKQASEMHFGWMHLSGCCESLNEPKLLVPVPAPAARSGSTGHQLAELGCALQELLGWVFFLAVLHELHHDSHPVGRADGCLLLLPPPHSGPWWLLPSCAATREGPSQGLQRGWGLFQPGFPSPGLDFPAAAGHHLPGHFPRCVSTQIVFLLESSRLLLSV